MATVIYAFDNVNNDQATKDALEQTLRLIDGFNEGKTQYRNSMTAPGKLYVNALFDATVKISSVKSMIQQLNSLNTALRYNITVIPKNPRTLVINDASKFLTIGEATSLMDTYSMVNIQYNTKGNNWICELLFNSSQSAAEAKAYIEDNRLFGNSGISYKF